MTLDGVHWPNHVFAFCAIRSPLNMPKSPLVDWIDKRTTTKKQSVNWLIVVSILGLDKAVQWIRLETFDFGISKWHSGQITVCVSGSSTAWIQCNYNCSNGKICWPQSTLLWIPIKVQLRSRTSYTTSNWPLGMSVVWWLCDGLFLIFELIDNFSCNCNKFYEISFRLLSFVWEMQAINSAHFLLSRKWKSNSSLHSIWSVSQRHAHHPKCECNSIRCKQKSLMRIERPGFHFDHFRRFRSTLT